MLTLQARTTSNSLLKAAEGYLDRLINQLSQQLEASLAAPRPSQAVFSVTPTLEPQRPLEAPPSVSVKPTLNNPRLPEVCSVTPTIKPTLREADCLVDKISNKITNNQPPEAVYLVVQQEVVDCLEPSQPRPRVVVFSAPLLRTNSNLPRPDRSSATQARRAVAGCLERKTTHRRTSSKISRNRVDCLVAGPVAVFSVHNLSRLNRTVPTLAAVSLVI